MKELWIKLKKWFDSGNHSILLCCSLLLIIGLMVCIFIGPYQVPHTHISPLFPYLFLYRALPFVIIGWMAMLLISRIKQRSTIITIAWLLTIIGLIGLLVTFFHTGTNYGILGLIKIGNFSFVPSVVLLPGFIVLISNFLGHQSDNGHVSKPKTVNLCISLIITLGLMCVLFYLQDPFMASIYLITYLVILGYSYLSTARMNKICLIIVCILVCLTLILSILSNNLTVYTQLYLARVNVAGSHLISSNIRWLGWLSDSVNSATISAIFARFGIIFAIFVLGLYAVLSTKLIQGASATKEKFNRLVLVGMISALLAFILMHVQQIYVGELASCWVSENSSNLLLRLCHLPTGFFPLRSPLPLVSFGEINLLVFCIMFGICANLLKNNK